MPNQCLVLAGSMASSETGIAPGSSTISQCMPPPRVADRLVALKAFLEHSSMSEHEGAGTGGGRPAGVSLSTIHGAKGREWATVILTRVNEEVFTARHVTSLSFNSLQSARSFVQRRTPSWLLPAVEAVLSLCGSLCGCHCAAVTERLLGSRVDRLYRSRDPQMTRTAAQQSNSQRSGGCSMLQ